MTGVATLKADKKTSKAGGLFIAHCLISIPDGKVLDGKIPSSKMKLLQAWVEIHKEELMADWALAVSGEQPYKIDPLK